jgi:hypothetical protein
LDGLPKISSCLSYERGGRYNSLAFLFRHGNYPAITLTSSPRPARAAFFSMQINELKEAIADYGIEKTLESCIQLIDQGYIDLYYPQGDKLFLKRCILSPLFYLRTMQDKHNSEGTETP